MIKEKMGRPLPMKTKHARMVYTFLMLLLLLLRMVVNYDSQLMEVTMTFANPAHL
jgi:hypothetical protein